MSVEFKDLASKKRNGKDCKQTWYKIVHVYGLYSNFLLFDFSNCKIYNKSRGQFTFSFSGCTIIYNEVHLLQKRLESDKQMQNNVFPRAIMVSLTNIEV